MLDEKQMKRLFIYTAQASIAYNSGLSKYGKSFCSSTEETHSFFAPFYEEVKDICSVSEFELDVLIFTVGATLIISAHQKINTETKENKI